MYNTGNQNPTIAFSYLVMVGNEIKGSRRLRTESQNPHYDESIGNNFRGNTEVTASRALYRQGQVLYFLALLVQPEAEVEDEDELKELEPLYYYGELANENIERHSHFAQVVNAYVCGFIDGRLLLSWCNNFQLSLFVPQSMVLISLVFNNFLLIK